MKNVLRGLERWGHYLLAALCAAVILLSALWTRDQRAAEAPDTQALSDQSQRLSDVAPPSPSPTLARPAEGPVRFPYSDLPVLDPRTGVWQVHPYVEFAAEPGGAVRSMLPGAVLSADGEVVIDHGGDTASRYRGLQTISVRAGQTLPAGAVLGTAADAVRVWLLQNGGSVPFGNEWLDNSPKTSYTDDNDQTSIGF